ncbi:ABC transporter substrate-binding protein [Flavobacteriales bacterium 34_180_T64]|nr:ABC transporter substrate-binding protein [Flavobacteriales bacterium 34_180_T64]
MLHIRSVFALLCSTTLFFSCIEDKQLKSQLPPAIVKQHVNTYAKGFKIFNHEFNTILKIKNPWPNAERSYQFLLLTKEQAASTELKKGEFDGIIITPVEKIVVTSTTHIPALELLGVEQTLVGFPGSDYISSEKTRHRIEKGLVRELGKNEGINTEVLLELQPDVVVGFGVDGTSKSLNTIKTSGIPVIYNGDWVETSPLAKAEWIKFFGVLYGKEKRADSIFRHIETDYINAKKLALHIENRPTVLSGAMHKDIWYLPSGTSPEAQILKDANVNYLWSDTTASGSLALSFETVYEKAKQAEIWLSPSYYSSYDDLEKANQHYLKFDAFQNKMVYTFSNTTGASGGVLYYELGMARPDLVLKDIIKVCHPKLLENYQPFFFKPLE